MPALYTTPAHAQPLALDTEVRSVSEPAIYVAYPPDGHTVPHSHVLLEGSVWPGGTLTLNGRAVTVGPDGLFVEWVPLRPGANTLTLVSRRGGVQALTRLQVSRGAARGAVPAPFVALPGRVAEVTEADIGAGLNTVRAAWEDGAGRAAVYGRQGQRAEVLGVRGDLTLLQLAGGPQVWASSGTLRLLPAGTPPPRARLGPPRTVAAGGWTELRLPLSERVPFDLRETAQGLQLTLYGVTPPAAEELARWPAAGAGRLAQVQLRPSAGPAAAGRQELLLRLRGGPLHGYQAGFQDGELVVRLRDLPRVDPAAPLRGRHIALDAGHGGPELGGAGPLRVREKDLVLPITLRAAELLQARGATVTLTRQRDEPVSLYRRPLLAEQAGADVLVSVHANAIPDGKDPRTVRGVGAYYTWPQAQPLARALQTALVAAHPALGDDGLHAGANLALTRPSSQPSVLLELGYLTDPQNLRFLMDPAGREAYAQAIAAGLEQYFAELGRVPAPAP